QSGWGMSITQHGATLFAALFVYNAQGRPQWIVMPGGTWNSAFNAYTGALYLPSGSWFGNYDPARFVPGGSVGSAILRLTGADAAVLDYTINGVSGSKALSRQGFGP